MFTRTIVAVAVAALATAGAATATASPPPDEVTFAAAGVEDDGADCPVTLPGSLTANSRLPDPFTKIDGTRVTAKSQWRCRRAEIKQLAERYVYGEKPPKPSSVTGTVSSSNITVNVSHNGRNASFSASVQLPNGSGPFPAVVVLGGFGADTATIRAAGAAVIDYDPLAVGREGTPRNNKQGAFYTLYGATSSTGLLAAWSWGVSRIIDVIEQSGGNVLRADATGVTGCSRYGKGAFAAGAFDQRIALTMPIESGSAGAPVFRGLQGESGAQPLSSAYGEQPWLGDAFSSFTANPANLPVDTHEVVGMIAPRGLFIMENPHVDWLGARSGSVAALGGAEVYKALGAGGNISYWSDVQDGTHCASRSEWRTPLQQSIQRFLVGTGSAPAVFRISSRKAGDLSEWRTWQTPTLSDGPPTDPPPAAGCTATASVSQWTGGFVATVRVTAGSSPVAGWTVTTALPSGTRIVNAWEATRSADTGTVTFTNVGHNGAVAAGQSVEFGFQGSGTGTGMTPACAAR
ncbi:cellulose binding domain-containing protein [Actinophytocola glycyrrhizae]|uniref:Cellulose binding domain-containing protein n=1 Tax=Actinophytocola glycyrrhizae TaxID=2044873 RepID=A0ABV9RT07_9PSEU